MQCGTPVYSIENGGAGAAHFGVAVGGLGCAKAARRWRWAPPAGARCPQPALPLLHTGNLPCCTSSGPRAHGCAEAGAHQPPRRRNSAVRGGSCRSAGQWRAPRPVSPGTATLMADARCARRSADALNELRPLRQRVSRARAFAYPLPPLAASALWPAVAGSLQPDAAGRGVAPPRRQPAINALDEPRAARWRSARGQRGARASVAPQPRPYSAAARAVLLSLTRRLCLQPDPAIRSRQGAPCIPSHGARPWETASPFLNTIRTRPLGIWPDVQAWPKMTGPCPDRP